MITQATCLLVPIPKNPYNRIGPLHWQDWYRQVRRTVDIARALHNGGKHVVIAIISEFHPRGGPSEADIYLDAFRAMAPELPIRVYRETNDTFGQVAKSFALARRLNAELHFVSAWMQYPRVLYLARERGESTTFSGAFGIPQPAFALIDPLCIVLQPIADLLGLGAVTSHLVVQQRQKGRIL